MNLHNRANLILAAAGLLFLASVACRDVSPLGQTSSSSSRTQASQPVASPAPSSGLLAAEQTLESMNAVKRRIRTGELTIEVKSFEKAAEEVGRIADSHGGYLVTSEASRDDEDHREGTLTIRVAAERFSEAFSAIKSLGSVQSEKIGTEDISKAYTDLQSRLQIKRQTEGRLREILRTQTGKLVEVLEVERELGRLTEEIEQMEGERRYYDQQVALSTITVRLGEPAAMLRKSVGAPLTKALREALDVFMNSLAVIVYVTSFLIPWLLIAIALWFLVRIVRRRRRARVQ